MKLIKTEDAVGSVLCHDITQIIPGVTKDAVFRKGHVVREEDIPVLLSVGKENLYVWEKQEGMLHENDAAEVLRQVKCPATSSLLLYGGRKGSAGITRQHYRALHSALSSDPRQEHRGCHTSCQKLCLRFAEGHAP